MVYQIASMRKAAYFNAINPTTYLLLDSEFKNASLNEIDEAAEKGKIAFNIHRKKDNNTITHFLEQIASEIENSGNKLIQRCHLKTALAIARLEGERSRTINQLYAFTNQK